MPFAGMPSRGPNGVTSDLVLTWPFSHGPHAPPLQSCTPSKHERMPLCWPRVTWHSCCSPSVHGPPASGPVPVPPVAPLPPDPIGGPGLWVSLSRTHPSITAAASGASIATIASLRSQPPAPRVAGEPESDADHLPEAFAICFT